MLKSVSSGVTSNGEFYTVTRTYTKLYIVPRMAQHGIAKMQADGSRVSAVVFQFSGISSLTI